MAKSNIETAPISAELWSDFVAVFEPSNGCDGCWCYNHRIPPGKPDVVGTDARDAMQQLFQAGSAGGILAYCDGVPAGWCAVDQREAIPGHDCVNTDNPSDWSIHCFFVPDAFRGKGVAQALLSAAIGLVEARSGSIVEAYARPPEQGSRAFDFLPSMSLFKDRPFEIISSLDANYCRLSLRLDSAFQEYEDEHR